jgi:hypothetical protein
MTSRADCMRATRRTFMLKRSKRIVVRIVIAR